MQRFFSDTGFLMKSISVVLVVLGIFGLVSGFMLAYNVERAGIEEEGQAFLEELRLQMAESLGLPLEDPSLQEPEENQETSDSTPDSSQDSDAPQEDENAIEPAAEGLTTEDVLAYYTFIAYLTIFEGMVQLLAGFVGILRSNRPEAQGLPTVMAVVMLIVWIVRTIFGDGNVLSIVMALIIPGLYLYSSIALRKQRGRRGGRTFNAPLPGAGRRASKRGGKNDDWLDRL